ncbi:hypothetical protein K6959_08035 [Bacillus aquiflavi]|nr:hypothetical protein [Bacillus aquiflavi]UAC49730.1 hypothetical protein K6959_08035 [Bacillus aquiflavi]
MNQRINKFWGSIIVILTAMGIFLAINQLFYLKLFSLSQLKHLTYIF